MINSAYGESLLRGRRGSPITDEVLYFAYANGITAIQLAEDLKTRERWIRTRIERGKERFEGKENIPFVEWLEGLGLWAEFEKTKQAECRHKPIPIGSATGCLRCLLTGLDSTLALQAIPVIPLDVTIPESDGPSGGIGEPNPDLIETEKQRKAREKQQSEPVKLKQTRKQKRSTLSSAVSSGSSSVKPPSQS